MASSLRWRLQLWSSVQHPVPPEVALTTAREQLLTEVTALNDLRGPALAAEIKRVMNNYRVQTKQGVDVTGAPTARDALGDRLAGLIQAGGTDLHIKLGTAIDAFRMQTKANTTTGSAGSAGSATAATRPARPARDLPLPIRVEPRVAKSMAGSPAGVAAGAAAVAGQAGGKQAARLPSHRSEPTPAVAPIAVPIGLRDPPPASARRSAEPAVHGGPRPRKKPRGECPKCHSLGVVLARSYSGDDYYSCIYCGWQTFKPVDENDPNVSLAVRLLGQTLGND